ncbi:hypothetical protein Indivirus_3_49 [Indivirus ILV1]|uniref:Uncharacterized protein n=1 Tax=Indivirus ILV1 TaxID=1977633 RepID=A0A1V0SDJ4_9VIRU|nr:hypothetical protein Indivirus_3_49 [Indivirus ILV1]
MSTEQFWNALENQNIELINQYSKLVDHNILKQGIYYSIIGNKMQSLTTLLNKVDLLEKEVLDSAMLAINYQFQDALTILERKYPIVAKYPLDIEFKCMDVNLIGKNIIENLEIYKKISPFKKYYGNITSRFDNNTKFKIYDLNYYQSNEGYKYDGSKYQIFDRKPNDKYSTNDIPVYFRTIPELKEMLEDNYYQEFNIDNIKIEQTAKNNGKYTIFNPTLNYSEICEKYIITPTVMPFSPENTTLIALNKKEGKYLASNAFFYNPNIIFDMYRIFNSLKEINIHFKYFTSLEVGSLPELLHFHVVKFNMLEPTLEKIEGTDFHKVIDNNPHSKMYAAAITNYYDYAKDDREFLYKLPALLLECRLNIEGNDKFKYCAQIFFSCVNQVDYVFISFRRVNIKNIKLVEGANGPTLDINYWKDLYGPSAIIPGSSSIKSTKQKILEWLVPLPIGMVSYKNKEGLPFDLSKDDLAVDMKKQFVYHPNFDGNAKLVYNSGYKPNYTFKTIPENIDTQCIDIDLKIEKTMLNTKLELRRSHIDCDKFPAIYNLGTTNVFGYNLVHGIGDLSGDQYYFIKVNSEEYDKIINKLYEYNDIQVFPTYYGSVTLTNNDTYMLFTGIKTDLKTFLKLDQDNLRNNSPLIHSIIVMIINRIIKLKEMNKRYPNLSIDNIYVTNESMELIDFKFSEDFIITIAKNNSAFKINHYGHNIVFKFADFISGNDLQSDIRTSINSLHWWCKQFNIQNDLLNDINNLVSGSEYNIKELLLKLSFGMNYGAFRDAIPNALFIYSYLNGEPSKDYNMLLKKIIEKVKTTNYTFPYGTTTLNKGTILVTGQGIDFEKGGPPDYLSLLESKFGTEMSSVWYGTIDELKKKRYQSLLNSQYMRINLLSRLLAVVLTDDVKFINLGIGEIYWVDLIKNIFIPGISQMLGLNKEKLLSILSPQIGFNDKSLDRKFVEDINKTYGRTLVGKDGAYNDYNLSAILIFQDLFNLALKFKYPDIAGTTAYINIDGMTEYVLTNTSKFAKLMGVVMPSPEGFRLFSNHNFYREHIYQIYKTIEQKRKNNESLNLQINEKLYARQMNDMIEPLKEKITEMLKSPYDFYTRPILDEDMYIFLPEINKYPYDNNAQYGGKKQKNNKYIKLYKYYKNMYIKLKKEYDT